MVTNLRPRSRLASSSSVSEKIPRSTTVTSVDVLDEENRVSNSNDRNGNGRNGWWGNQELGEEAFETLTGLNS